ncbi:MAG: hypothetical protein FD169_1512 [Bacillota bacterium]|nr:MAG: hypothetical protein FD169_1512 [Bacillota bacterium]MBS3949469.1 HPr family phosphocarrier protein [Peptococcaceae bacterium]
MSEEKALVTIRNDVIHFRPIARLKDLGRKLDVDIYLSYQGETFSISSIIAITAWELQRGCQIEVLVRGTGDVSSELRTIVAFVEGGWGE